jgi:RNA polymerase sigma factor (sigma-70 family)
MPDEDLADRFETQRRHLRAVAYRLLGSMGEADDAVQEAWLRLGRVDPTTIDNLGGWLTTVVGRICLDMLRSRSSRREASLDFRFTDPAAAGRTPDEEAVAAEDVGLALLVVLERLSPAERVAFVLHDLFAVPFDQVAPVVERSVATTKKLASRARHRVQGQSPPPDADLTRHRHLVDAFLTATRSGDVAGLLAVLAPDVVRRADPAVVPAGVPVELHGAQEVAEETAGNAARARFAVAVLVDGTVGAAVAPSGHLALALAFTFAGDQIATIDVIADPERLHALALSLPTS